jgi:hypothetical protein
MAADILWDAELEELAQRAIAVHGEEAVLEVTDRTIHERVANRATAALSAADIKTALKAELRRLVKPN